MSQLSLHTFGRADVLLDGQPVKWGAESARELVFYLLAQPEGRSRSEIIDSLWREEDSARSSNRFRVALHRARTALGGPDAIQEAHGAYRLAPEVLRASDVYTLYAALAEAERSEGEARGQALDRAVAAYQGEFLPHLQADWVQVAREEYQSAYTRARLERSVLHCEHLHCARAVQDLAGALRADPYLGENHHQQLMTCLSVVQDKYAATEHYRRFLKFLRDELGDTPMPETVELAERIKAGESVCHRANRDSAQPQLCPLVSDGHCSGQFTRLLDRLPEER